MTMWSCQEDLFDYEQTEMRNEDEIEVIDFKVPKFKNSGNFTHSGTMLSFPTFDDFEQTLNFLEQELENHEDAFVLKYENNSDDELDSLEEVVGFNSQQPLIDFENEHNFQFSLRKLYNELEENWLDNEELDPATDPDNEFAFDEIMQTLLNDNQEIMIEGKVFSFGKEGKDYEITGDFTNSLNSVNSNSVSESDPNIKSYTYVTYGGPACRNWAGNDFYHDYAYKRKVKKRLVIRSVPFFCKTKAQIKSYKKKRRRWKKHRTRLGVGLQTYLKDNNCERTVRQGWKDKSIKSRKTRTVRMHDWGFGYALKAKNAQSVYGVFYYNGNNANHVLSW